MNHYHSSVYELWNKFIQSKPEFKDEKFDSWHFCNTENCANKLVELVKKGIKRATTSLKYWYERGDEHYPFVGEFNVITNWDGVAQCISRTVKVTILPFKDVTDEMAFIEEEGDKSLKYWKEGHFEFFQNDLKNVKINFTEDMQVVFEEFEMIYEKNF